MYDLPHREAVRTLLPNPIIIRYPGMGVKELLGNHADSTHTGLSLSPPIRAIMYPCKLRGNHENSRRSGWFASRLPAVRHAIRPIYRERGILPVDVASGMTGGSAS